MSHVRPDAQIGRRSAMPKAARRMRRPVRSCLASAALLLLAGCSTQRMPILNPTGSVGEAEARLFYLAVGVMLLIIVPVMLGTLWLAWHYRASSRKHDYDPEFDDSPVINKVTLFVPLFTIAILGSLTWVYTHRLDPYRPMPGDQRPYEIQAISFDYKWAFIYPEEGIATLNELVAPVGRPVTLRMTSDPMMTSIFIPGLISQIYAMPGMETRANFMAEQTAVKQGANAMYSGPGFEYQRFKTRLVTPEEFSAWVASVKQGRSEGAKPLPMFDWAQYQALLPQSTDTPVTHYARIDPEIFSKSVRKYMPHYRLQPLPDRVQFDAGMQSAPAGAQAPSPEAPHAAHSAAMHRAAASNPTQEER